MPVGLAGCLILAFAVQLGVGHAVHGHRMIEAVTVGDPVAHPVQVQVGVIEDEFRRAEGDAGARIGAGHQRIHVVSHRVQPRDEVSFGIDDLGIGGGDQAP